MSLGQSFEAKLFQKVGLQNVRYETGVLKNLGAW